MSPSDPPPSPPRTPWFPVFPRLFFWTFVATAYSTVAAAVVAANAWAQWPEGVEVSAAIGVLSSILLVFRNNAAYARWNEARTLWGRLNNEIRNLALKADAYARTSPSERQELVRCLAGFPHALRLHLQPPKGLRGPMRLADVPGFAGCETNHPHLPGAIASRVYDVIAGWARRGAVVDPRLVDGHAAALLEVAGGCERLKNTPPPASYRALMRIGLLTFVLAAPWSTARDVGWWAPLVMCVSSFFLLGVAFATEAVEEPFSERGEGLPLQTYCEGIEAFVHAALPPGPPVSTVGLPPP